MNQMGEFYIYDLETFLRCFLFIGKFKGSNAIDVFEISSRRNDRDALLARLSYLQNCNVTMVGYNSLNFDYPIIHDLMTNPYTFDTHRAYTLGQEIIKGGDYGFNTIRMHNRIIPQLDLVKLNHFDNKSKRVSLKALQFAMRSESVEDLPFHVDRELTHEEMDQLVSYGCHDVTETEAFLGKCERSIEMRKEILDSGVLMGDVLNYSDVKIGTEYLIKKIGRSKCFVSGSKPRQSFRESVPFNSIVLPKNQYRTEEYQAVCDWFKSQTVWVGKKGGKPELEVPLAGLDFHFGLGGVHASVKNKKYTSNDTHVIKDVDVTGMYVSVAIANDFYPEHLGQDFVTAYKQLKRDRARYPKGTTMNATLKLAGNGVYGNSNNPYSCFFDPKYLYTVTSNGQLQLIQLVEVLSAIPGLEIIQANTDGITVYMPRELEPFFNLWKSDWEKATGLDLEEVEYSNMWIADVNNYLAIDTNGKVKRKGRYWYPESDDDYEGVWNKDFSSLCVQKAIGQVLINGWEPEDVLRCISDPFDFMLRYKTPGAATVYIGDQAASKTVRYYVSKTGGAMKKIAKPKGRIGDFKRKNKLTDEYFNKILSELPEGVWDERIHTKNKSKYQQVTTSIQSGWQVSECNIASKFDWNNLNYDYYIEEVKKLII